MVTDHALCSIPAHLQKLRSGFPPRELCPPSDPSQPVSLANGDKVSVEKLPDPMAAETKELASSTSGSTQLQTAVSEEQTQVQQSMSLCLS